MRGFVVGVGQYVVARKLVVGYAVRNALCRGNHHFRVNRVRPHVKRAAEKSREYKHVVYLVGMLGGARSHYKRARVQSVLRAYFGYGIRAGEKYGLIRHGFNHILRNAIGTRNADKHVRAAHSVRKLAFKARLVRNLCDFLLRRVKPFLAIADYSLQIAKGNVLYAVQH